MTFKTQTSLKVKLVGMMTLTSLMVLLLTFVLLFSFEAVNYRKTSARHLASMADTIAANSASVLIFDDRQQAEQILSGLRVEPGITEAAFFDKDGKLYASYPATNQPSDFPLRPEPAGLHVTPSAIQIFTPIMQAHRLAGTLYLREKLDLLQHLQIYGAMTFLILVCSGLAALFLSHLFQRQISQPLLSLAEVARTVSKQKDYSVRAPQFSGDELSYLTDAFNTMLEEIQANHSALRKNEEQLRMVADHASVFLCQIDRSHRYQFVNRVMAARHGVEPDALIGKPISDFIGVPAYETIRPYLETAFEGHRVEYELELPYSTMGHRWIHAVYMPEVAPDGNVMTVVAVITDISLRKQQQQQVENARDEALRASRAKDDFLAALSHELRTPLNPVLLVASDAARDTMLPARVREDFDMIRRNVELEARLIDDLLDITRITRGKLVLKSRLLNAHDVLREAINKVNAEADGSWTNLVVEFNAREVSVQADPLRLQQVFWNVLKNSIKFTPKTGKITVQTFNAADKLIIKVSDTGIGMNANELKRVFDVFAQGDHAESRPHSFGGLGLGLAISRKLVELHSGSIEASSKGPNQGSTFTIELPLARPANPVTDTAPNLTDHPAALSPGASVLLVENHEPTRTALTDLLTARKFKVIAASSVAQAQEAARRSKVDFIMSEIGLPDGNGYTLMSELRKLYGVAGIALSGHGIFEDVERSKSSGFVAHLGKPVRVEDLETALAKVVATLPKHS